MVLSRTFRSIAALHEDMKTTLHSWWSRYSEEQFAGVVSVVQNHLSVLGPRGDSRELVAPVAVLKELYSVNEESHIVPFQRFYNDVLSSALDRENSYLRWIRRDNVFNLLDNPFLLNTIAKSDLFHVDAALEQMGHQLEGEYLVLQVHRESLIEDTIALLSACEIVPQVFQRPLRVIMRGEQAVDEGGVRKEFFQLVTREIFNPKYGMFVETEKRQAWFNQVSLENEQEFHLVGVLLGLAAYNRVLLPVRFPLVVYMMLRGFAPTLALLKDAFPIIGRGLEELLAFDGDIEEAFCLMFAVNYERYGEIGVHELKPGGASLPVREDNRNEYVKLFVEYMCRDAVQRQFTAFKCGFDLVCANHALQLFRAEELESLICGETSENIDLLHLRRNVVYDGGFSDDHPFIRNFWDVLSHLPQPLRKKFLFFCSGSDRVPIAGLSSMRFIVQRAGPDSNSLPTASTCFNYLVIPEYSTEEKLRERLCTALDNCEGFGMR
eukprot:TRINITY_DN1671_c0_g1_i12.p2 TRINITY_DN1671_c0_g1~~TRINITY_DN1671_c0_g1_i12.p2  ORF type:complete len:493 (+),score=116.51 TRINITY_DN1671_c0_g1_i12:1710-3188(+)